MHLTHVVSGSFRDYNVACCVMKEGVCQVNDFTLSLLWYLVALQIRGEFMHACGELQGLQGRVGCLNGCTKVI